MTSRRSKIHCVVQAVTSEVQHCKADWTTDHPDHTDHTADYTDDVDPMDAMNHVRGNRATGYELDCEVSVARRSGSTA